MLCFLFFFPLFFLIHSPSSQLTLFSFPSPTPLFFSLIIKVQNREQTMLQLLRLDPETGTLPLSLTHYLTILTDLFDKFILFCFACFLNVLQKNSDIYFDDLFDLLSKLKFSVTIDFRLVLFFHLHIFKKLFFCMQFIF